MTAQDADYVAVAQCADECGGDHGQDLMSYPFHARGCPVEKELRPYWNAQFKKAQELIRRQRIRLNPEQFDGKVSGT